MRKLLLSGFAGGWVLLFVVGCGPKYPNCSNDEHCAAKQEYCVENQCQQCRLTEHCAKGNECASGRCQPIEGYCETEEDCDGQICRENSCLPCGSDEDCASGLKCFEEKCVECISAGDCEENFECVSGKCTSPPPPDETAPAICQPDPIYFDFDDSSIRVDARDVLGQAADCIRSVTDITLRVEGHCDPRGTEGYNLALGDRRSQSVKSYLVRLGIDPSKLRAVSKGELEATGEDEAGWAEDRRVIFIWEQ